MNKASWDQIDAWPIKESGLPPRVVNSAGSFGLQTVKDIREMKPGTIKGIGIESQYDIDQFLRICRMIVDGKRPFNDIYTLLNSILTKTQMEIIAYLYLLHEQFPVRRARTLQSVGNIKKISRERIRQIQKSAVQILCSNLTRLCLDPFIDSFLNFINTNGKAVTHEELSGFPSKNLLGGINISGLFILLSDCAVLPVLNKRFFLTSVNEEDIIYIEEHINNILAGGLLLSAEDIFSQIKLSDPGRTGHDISRKVLSCCLEFNPQIIKLKDGRYGSTASRREVLQAVILETIPSMPVPVHFRTIHRAVNDMLKNGSKTGPGHVLKAIETMGEMKKKAAGYYEWHSSGRDNHTK